MVVRFEDEELALLYNTGKSRKYKTITRDARLLEAYLKIIRIFAQEENTNRLSNYSFLHYEKLKHQLSGKSSVRLLNGHVERLIFTEENDGIVVNLIEINEKHYGNKK